MTSRVATAAVGLPLLALVIWAGPPWFSFLVAVAAAIGALELCHMARQRGRRPMALVAAVWAVALVGGAHFVASDSTDEAALPALAVTLAIVAGGALVSLIWMLLRSGHGVGLGDWAVTAGAALYIGGLLSYAPLIWGLGEGREWVFLAVGVIFAADTAAFATGKSVGRRPMAPTVSPGKTWEGSLGGLLGAVAACVAFTALLDLGVAVALAVVLGALMAVVGQLGDLAQSRLKRAAGVKDSGWLVPGHGGLLDRLDSIVFNLPLVYYFVMWVIQ